MHKFGRFPEKTYADMARVAVSNALEDAGVAWQEIPIIYCGSSLSKSGHGLEVVAQLGHTGIPVVNVEAFCISALAGVRLAYQAIAGGFYDIAVTVAYERQERGFIPAIAVEDWERRQGLGAIPCIIYAQAAMRRMHEYGWKPEHLAMQSVKSHKLAALTPYSHYPMPNLSIEDVLNSAMICDPLTMLMLSPPSDGAAAAVLCAKEVAHKYANKKPITIAACVQTTRKYDSMKPPFDSHEMGTRAAREAYESAGVGPEDVDVAALHDATSLTELLTYEDAMFCKEGEGNRLIEEGVTDLGGKLPVNTDGSFVSRGNAAGACGLASLSELVWQLRGEAGARQVSGAKLALILTYGFGPHCNSTILKR
jgi:acetyl-CoA acetyltransferase